VAGTWSDIALAIHHRPIGILSYRLNGLRKGDEHPAYSPAPSPGKLPLKMGAPKSMTTRTVCNCA